jgi:hypothetical protein
LGLFDAWPGFLSTPPLYHRRFTPVNNNFEKKYYTSPDQLRYDVAMWFWVIVLIVVCWALGSVKRRKVWNKKPMCPPIPVVQQIERFPHSNSDNQIHVDKSVSELVQNGYFVARISDDCASEHPLYEKLKGSLIALVATDQYKFPMYASIRKTGLFADDYNPVRIEYVDETEIKRGRKR